MPNWRNLFKFAGDYRATVDKGRRQNVKKQTRSEDAHLPRSERRTLIATTRDQLRNLSLVSWMVRRHLDYVSRFDLHVRTGTPELDQRLRSLFAWHGRRENIDIAGRHDRAEMMRLFELHKTIDGDCALVRLQSGHWQPIEADRITKPADIDAAQFDRVNEHGLVLDQYGRVEQFCICKREPNSSLVVFDHMEPAENVDFDGYFTRFDQARGVSPLASALNTFADLYEGWEWTLLKIKLHSLFGLAIKREATAGDLPGAALNTDTDTSGASYTEQIQNSLKGVMMLDLDAGDSVDTIESRTPSGEMIDFSNVMIRIALLALDIPYTFYDSLASSFSARIADRALYEESVDFKRAKNRAVLDNYTRWRLSYWVGSLLADDLRKYAPSVTNPVTWLADKCEWIPAGTPWLDKLKEVQGDGYAISCGLDSRQRICRKRGRDFFKIVDELAEEEAYAKERGVTLMVGASGQIGVTTGDEEVPDRDNETDTP